MRRSTLRPGTTPMKRTAFARGEHIETREVSKLQRVAPVRKTKMKSSRPRMTPIRRAARGQGCTLQLPGICNHACDTTVLCHSNGCAHVHGPDVCAEQAPEQARKLLHHRSLPPEAVAWHRTSKELNSSSNQGLQLGEPILNFDTPKVQAARARAA